MRQNYFFEYVPNAYINLCVDKAQQMANNRFVYDFKAGEKKAAHLCAEWLVRYLTKQYSSILEDFNGKQVILFDDLLTSGKTIEDFRSKLEAAGAYVEREIFLARTIHHDPISNRGVLQEMAEGFYEAVAHSKRCFPQGVNINKKSNNNYNKVA